MANTGVAGNHDRLRPEELADRIVPNEPRLSPDGLQVIFCADPVGRKEEKKRTTLWVASADGNARKLTSGAADDRDPMWSPDGARILFVSNRLAKKEDEEQRLFLLPLDGGEPSPLGELAGSLSNPTWSPDGRFVAILRRDPETEEVRARKKERKDAVVIEEDHRFKRLWLVNAESGKSRCLTTGEREVRSYCWMPDGSGLVTITTDDPQTDAFYGNADVWSVPVEGGLPRRITTFATAPSSPVAVETIEGVMIVVRADGGKADPADSMWVAPHMGGEPRRLLPESAGSVEEVCALPGRPGSVAARIVERTHAKLYAVDALTGKMCTLTSSEFQHGSILSGPSFSASGDRFATVWSDASTPEEVYLGTTGDNALAVTRFGASFQGRLQPVEHVTWKSDDGVEIEGLLTFPRGYRDGERFPLIVEVHGGPSWQWEDRVMLDWHDWAQLLASHGYAVLLPNPRGSTAYGAEFQRLLQDDIGGGECRDLISGALAMVDRGIADPDRLGIGGWSWGGYLTAWTITQTPIFKAAVMGAGLANLVSDHGQGDIPSMNLLLYPGQPYHHLDAYWNTSPIRFVAAVQTPTLILHGDEDARVHPAQGMEYFRALKILGVPVRFVRYPREDHGIHEREHQIDLMERVLEWFERWLMN